MPHPLQKQMEESVWGRPSVAPSVANLPPSDSNQAVSQATQSENATEIITAAQSQLVAPPLVSPMLEGLPNQLTPAWNYWFQKLWKRTGGAISSGSVDDPMIQNAFAGIHGESSASSDDPMSAFADIHGESSNTDDLSLINSIPSHRYSDPKRNLRFCGVATLPSYHDNGDGTVTIGTGEYYIRNNSTGPGEVNNYTVAGATLTLTDGTVNYIYIDYNGGLPAIKNTTTRTDISNTKLMTASPIYTVYRSGNVLHSISWDQAAIGATEKLLLRTINIHRFERESGLLISDSGSLQFAISSGVVWYGVNNQTLDAIASATDTCYLYQYNGSTWSSSTVTTFNNTQYQGSSGFVTLTANRYAVNWIYRGVEDEKHCYIVLGTGDYKLIEAQMAQPPANLPAIIPAHAILVGRIIVLKSATSATEVDSAFVTEFSSGAISNHNDLSGRSDADCHPASSITNTPAGVIAATTVQAAIDELATEKAPKADPILTGTETLGTYAKRAVVRKTAIADNTATPVFTVTTTNESGSNDGGVYGCRIRATICHYAGTATEATSSYIATVYGEYAFSRVMIAAGTGNNGAVEVIKQLASVANSSANRDISTITVTIAETSEFVQTVSFQVDLTGTNASVCSVTAEVELLYSGFNTAPTIATA